MLLPKDDVKYEILTSRPQVFMVADLQSRTPNIKNRCVCTIVVIMRLRNLSCSFESFHCAMSAHDALSSLETLQIKIVEEFDT